MTGIFKLFDINGNGRIEEAEFILKHKELDLPGDPKEILRCLDLDCDGTLSINEINAWLESIWSLFKRWIVRTFSSEDEFVKKLRKKSTPMLRHTAIFKPTDADRYSMTGQVSREDFVDHLCSFGWHIRFEPMLFHHLDADGNGFITASELNFFLEEMRAYRCQRDLKNKAETGLRSEYALLSLKLFLRQHFGSIFAAWRLVLDHNGDGRISRSHFEKAVHLLGWEGDLQAAYRALDPMSPEFICLEDLSFVEAQLLARFRHWLHARLGPSLRLQQGEGLDMHRVLRLLASAGKVKLSKDRQLRRNGFKRALTNLSCPVDAKDTCTLLDSDQSGGVGADDLNVLYKVHFSQESLLAEPNHEAAQGFRDLCLQTHGHMFRAWRHCIDQDDTGKAKWREVAAAAAGMGFNGDLRGAWAALDHRGQGYLTLHNLDPNTYDIITKFRTWASAKFGGVMVAFRALDTDCQGSLSKVEFGKAAYAYGFQGDLERTWATLNFNGGSTLEPSEMAWLDNWQIEVLPGKPIKEMVARQADTDSDEEFQEVVVQESFDVGDLLRSVGWQSMDPRHLVDRKAEFTCQLDETPHAASPRAAADLTVGLPFLQAPASLLSSPRSPRRLAQAEDIDDIRAPPWLRKALALDPEPRIYSSTCSSRGRCSGQKTSSQ